jgi:hypothetical protein
MRIVRSSGSGRPTVVGRRPAASSSPVSPEGHNAVADELPPRLRPSKPAEDHPTYHAKWRRVLPHNEPGKFKRHGCARDDGLWEATVENCTE